MTYIWLAILIFSLIAEALTAALVAIWFVPGILAGLILSSFNVNIIVQIIVFIIISALCIIFFSSKLRENILKKGAKTNLDAIVGSIAVVEEDFSRGKSGRVRIMGQSWSALTDSQRMLLKGETVKILRIEGVKLICEPYEDKVEIQEKYIGQNARVEVEIDNFIATGRIIIDGLSFLAKSLDNDIIPVRTIVKIVNIEDDKYVCIKTE